MREVDKKIARIYFRGSSISVQKFEVIPSAKGRLLVRAVIKYPNDYQQHEYENTVYPGDPMHNIICQTLGIKKS